MKVYRCQECSRELERVYVFEKKDLEYGDSYWHPIMNGSWCGPMALIKEEDENCRVRSDSS